MRALDKGGYKDKAFFVGNNPDIIYNGFQGMFRWTLPDILTTGKSPRAYCEENLNEYTKECVKERVGPNGLAIAMVYPGFDDAKILNWGGGQHRKINIDRGVFYRGSWEAAISSGLDWVLIATFNDWNEGTNIEPDYSKGYALAEITREYAEKFTGKTLPKGEVERITNEYLKAKASS